MRKSHGLCRLLSFIIVSILTFNATAQPAPAIIESQQRFHPIVGRHGVVATQELQASHVGLAILKKGGNAVDAAVAVGFALAVTLPRAGNLGGGGFMLIWLNAKQQAIAINYREMAPQMASADLFLRADGTIDKDKLLNTFYGSGVPGTVAGLIRAQQKFGKLDLKTVMQPAIELAKQGMLVSPGTADAMLQAKGRLAKDPAAKRIFYKANGDVYRAGERLKQHDLAASLQAIANQGENAFYQGEIAKKIVAAMANHQGVISANDLANYRVEVTVPVRGQYHGYTILSMPPPSSGGVSIIEMLNILEAFPLASLGHNSADSIHRFVETMNLVFNDRNTLLGDPNFVAMPLQKLLSKSYAAMLRHKMNLQKHTPSTEISRLKPLALEGRNTTHYSIIDKDSNVVVNTYTLNHSFGNAKVIPGTGILMNNEMDDFTILAGKANSYGLVQGDKNVIAPGKRPLSSMTPTIVLDNQNHPVLATGSPGGSRIITTVLQVIINVIDYRFNIASAVAIPRVHSQLWPDVLYIEQGISPDTQARLIQMGHHIVTTTAMGSAQTVSQEDDTRQGAADPRRAGAAALAY